MPARFGLGLHLGGVREVPVRLALLQETERLGAVTRHALALEERAPRPSPVPSQVMPVEDGLRVLLAVALGVGVLDAQHEDPAGLAGPAAS